MKKSKKMLSKDPFKWYSKNRVYMPGLPEERIKASLKRDILRNFLIRKAIVG